LLTPYLPDTKLFLQQAMFQHVATFHTNTTNSGLHCGLHIIDFQKNFTSNWSLTHWMPAKKHYTYSALHRRNQRVEFVHTMTIQKAKSTATLVQVYWHTCTPDPLNSPFFCKREKVVLEGRDMYKVFCITVKIGTANGCNVRVLCMTMHQCICCREWPCISGVCYRSFSCKDILND
jgi:hypothetical protein